MRDSVMMYVSQCDALRDLPAEQFKRAVVAIWDYAMKDIEPEADPVTMMAWKLCKPLLDRNNRNYENSKRTRSDFEANPERTASEPLATWERTASDMGANHERTTSDLEANPEPKVKGERLKDKDNKEREKRESAQRFHPPSVDEVRAYAIEKGYNVDAERFVDFYTSKGWKVGSAPMKDWKAAVRNWSRSERQGQATKPKNNSNFQSRDIDLDNLLKAGGLYG